MEISVLLNKMVIFVALMVIGYFLARKKIIGQEFTRTMSRLVLDVFMVGTILSSMISTGSERELTNLGEILLLTFVTTLLGYLLAVIFCRFIPVEKENAPSYEILMAVSNNMFIALPIADALYGSYAVFIVSMSCIPFNVFLYSYGVWRLKGREQSTGKGLRLKDMFSIPLIATLVGIILIVTHIPVPTAVKGVFSSLAGATMPLSMMVIGSSLGSVSLIDAFRNPRLAILSLARLIVIPVLTFFVLRLLTSDAVLLMTCTIIAAAPCAVIVSVLAIQYGRDGIFSSEGVQHSTVCSMLTIPLLIKLLSALV
ncbi:MAG: AEC family transporter [Oscillospiraceae bacterium]|nr:AEC family transporter [Oscillospiraceae bacterium]MBQ9664051.1 AEC family transporter [Oscillospiraceae bacterium]